MQCKLNKNIEGDAIILGSHLFHSPFLVENNISIATVGSFLEQVCACYLLMLSCICFFPTLDNYIIDFQEFLVYQELSNYYPKFCHRMQKEIIDILLQRVYLSSKCIGRSITLVNQGMLSRTIGVEGLDHCIHYLSEAIEVIVGNINLLFDMPIKYVNSFLFSFLTWINKFVQNGSCDATRVIADNQLAVIYCLRALITHEANPTSKVWFL